jgi:hypothetical protein
VIADRSVVLRVQGRNLVLEATSFPLIDPRAIFGDTLFANIDIYLLEVEVP